MAANRSQVPLLVAAIGVFGILIPWWKGTEFADVLVFLPYCCLVWVFLVPAVTSVAETPEPARAFWPKVAKAFVFSWGAALLILILGLVTINLKSHWHGRPLLPDGTMAFNAIALGVAGSLLFTSAAAMLAVTWRNAVKARNVLRMILLAGLLGVAFWINRAPEDQRIGGVLLVSTGEPLQLAVPALAISALIAAALVTLTSRRLPN